LGAKINPGMALTQFPSRIMDETRFEPRTFRVEFNRYPLDRTDAKKTLELINFLNLNIPQKGVTCQHQQEVFFA